MLQRLRSRLTVAFFWYHSTETFRRGTFLCCVTENLWLRKSLWNRSGEGECRNFPSNIFVSMCPIISWRNTSELCFRKFLVAEKFMEKKFMEGGQSKFSVEKSLSESTLTFRRGTP